MRYNTSFTVRVESCWQAEPHHHSWVIEVVLKDTEAFLSCTEILTEYGERDGYVFRAPIDLEWGWSLYDELKRIQIPAFPEHIIGCDGAHYELETLPRFCYRWWSVPPKGWEPLHALAKKVLDRFYKELELVRAERAAGIHRDRRG